MPLEILDKTGKYSLLVEQQQSQAILHVYRSQEGLSKCNCISNIQCYGNPTTPDCSTSTTYMLSLLCL